MILPKFLLKITSFYYPVFLKKAILRKLFKLVAKGSGSTIPPLNQVSYNVLLKNFACFTRNLAEDYLAQGTEVIRIEESLFIEAAAIGRFFRKSFRIHRIKDVIFLGKIIYQALQIELTGEQTGRVIISRCYFSEFYSPKVCRLISAIDRGLFFGLTGGVELIFSQRITEGNEKCLAFFKSI